MPNSYVLDITNDTRRFLEGLESKHFKQVALKMLSLLRDPYPNDSELLKGSNKLRRVDIGEYRIVYEVRGDVVAIAVVGPRNDGVVYKRR